MNGATSLSEVSKAELSANTTLSANANSATGTLGNSVEDIDSVFRMTVQNFMSTGINGNVGLNKDRIDAFKTSIGDYVTDVNNALEKFNAADANAAFGPVIGGKASTSRCRPTSNTATVPTCSSACAPTLPHCITGEMSVLIT